MLRGSGYFFAGLLGLTLLAFWRSYLSRLPGDFDGYTHLHAAVMLCWFGLWIAQPFLIRRERRALHRVLGRISLALAPVVVLVIVLLTHRRLRAVPQERIAQEAQSYFLPLAMIVLFVVAYALAVLHRRTVGLHARYMICTSLAILDPVIARVVYFYVTPLPRPEHHQVVSLAVSVALLVALLLLDGAQRAGRTVYATMLAVTVAVYALFFTAATTPAWLGAVRWFRDLPLT